MLETVLGLDREMMVAFNGPDWHSLQWDIFFYSVSKIAIWIPVFLFLLYTIIKSKKKESVFVILGIALVFLFADRITSGLMKPMFERLRPSHDPLVMEQLKYAFGYTGGQFGFPSSHAANSFAFATFLSLVFRNKLLTFSISLWAVLCSYSRIYLGVHFPGDILVGALIGTLIGIGVYYIIGFLKSRFPQFCVNSGFKPYDVNILCFLLLAQVLTMFFAGLGLK